jgi:hypothetical protein
VMEGSVGIGVVKAWTGLRGRSCVELCPCAMCTE